MKKTVAELLGEAIIKDSIQYALNRQPKEHKIKICPHYSCYHTKNHNLTDIENLICSKDYWNCAIFLEIDQGV